VVGSRTIVIAGAGLGGLTTALALAEHGFRSVVVEQAERLEAIGAGIQLSPNATRILMQLGLADRLRPAAVVPSCIRVVRARDGSEIISIPLSDMEERYGAPYWVIHRGDLLGALLGAARENPEISLELGARVETFASHPNGVTVKALRRNSAVDAQGSCLIGADGLWSVVRAGLGDSEPPRFARRVAWRAMVPADMAPPQMRAPEVTLWLGGRSHIVHYPVQGGHTINVVAISADDWKEPGWSTEAKPEDVLTRFPAGRWSRHVRDLLGIPERWMKWALADRPVPKQWGLDQTTLLGDAAHPTMPYLAQGAALAIEDAAVLAARLGANPENPAAALRLYEDDRRTRAMQVQKAARKNGNVYQYSGPDAVARNIVMRVLGGARLRNRYDWIYNWRLDGALQDAKQKVG
jgi:salicylate hydroxylase